MAREFIPSIDTGVGGGDLSGFLPGSYAFPPYRRILPAGDNTATGVSTSSDIVIEFDAVQDAVKHQGYYLYPDVVQMRQPNTKLLQQHASRENLIGGFGLLYTVTGTDGAGDPIVGEYIPCTIDYETGFGPKDLAESPGAPVRLRLNPQPGGSTRATLPDNTIIELLFERQLPAQLVAY